MKNVRAKFKCDEVTKTVDGQTIRMSLVTSGGEENDLFFRWTPFASLEMGTANPDITFVPGREYYIYCTPAQPDDEH
jgi:hypothetical protein